MRRRSGSTAMSAVVDMIVDGIGGWPLVPCLGGAAIDTMPSSPHDARAEMNSEKRQEPSPTRMNADQATNSIALFYPRSPR
jgi:hypothetical protein